jgi:type VI protein secretion system component VasK
LIPAVVLRAIALLGLIGWLVLRAENAQSERTLQATAERIAAEHEAAERAERKQATANIDSLNHALDDLRAHNPWAGNKPSAASVKTIVPAEK